MHAVSLDGTFFGCRYAIGAMRVNGKGSIINISSRSGLVGIPAASAYAPARMAAFVADTPMRRFGTVEDVASIALLLASDEAAYMTGTEYDRDRIDGRQRAACGLCRGTEGRLIAHGDASRNDRRTENMTELVLNPALVRQIRLAGLFYLVIFVAGFCRVTSAR